jgi:hypothetical protein
MEKKKTKRKPKERLVEITRADSFSIHIEFQLTMEQVAYLGGRGIGVKFMKKDFFCSQKAECLPSEAEATSKALAEFCSGQNSESAARYIEEWRKLATPPKDKENTNPPT